MSLSTTNPGSKDNVNLCLEALNALDKPSSALEICRKLNESLTKKEVNSVLYKLESIGLVNMEQSRPPLWYLPKQSSSKPSGYDCRDDDVVDGQRSHRDNLQTVMDALWTADRKTASLHDLCRLMKHSKMFCEKKLSVEETKLCLDKLVKKGKIMSTYTLKTELHDRLFLPTKVCDPVSLPKVERSTAVKEVPSRIKSVNAASATSSSGDTSSGCNRAKPTVGFNRYWWRDYCEQPSESTSGKE